MWVFYLPANATGLEGIEPSTAVLETAGLPLAYRPKALAGGAGEARLKLNFYFFGLGIFTSLCVVLFLSHLQYFFNSKGVLVNLTFLSVV